MKIGVVGKDCPVLHVLLAEHGAKECPPEKADLIVAYGGDGTLLGAEREYPGILKYPIRDSETAPLCPEHALRDQLELFFRGELGRTFLPKLIALPENHGPLYAINDIFIHNSCNSSALRYKVWIDGKLYAREIVGDGVGVSTVHGATAYYRSITHSVFRVGIGLAFSNSTELVNHLVLPETSVVRVHVTRGPGELVADNSPDTPKLLDGFECVIRLSDLRTEVVGLDVFMCPECRRLRHQMRREFTAADVH